MSFAKLTLTLSGAVCVLGLHAAAANAATTDVASLIVLPERGQTADQARRDRYECHNWAIEQTGSAPIPVDREAERAQTRGERADKIVAGAAIGAVLGTLIRGGRRHEAAEGAVGGAVVGAAAGAIAGKRSRNRDDEMADDANADYVRALSACLEGRGYAVAGETGGDSA